jgi:hypothetical protein
MNNYLSCNLMGGLGNQMFQAAHVFCQGLKHNRPVFLRPHSWTPMQGKQTNEYVDNIFKNFTFTENLEDFKTIGEGPWEYSEVKPFEESTIFEGYFQSHKNFLSYEEEVLNLFSIDDETKQYLEQKYPEITKPKTISIHIRKGDYLQNPDIHPTVGLSYIEKSLETIGEYSHIFIFSDDKEWIIQNLKYKNMTIVDEEKDYLDMWLMSLCENNIISNSTFSWWGSFLNKNKNKKVCAPSIWFGQRGPQNFKDIYYPSWEVINVESKNGILEYVA